jgi:hypothetical protein
MIRDVTSFSFDPFNEENVVIHLSDLSNSGYTFAFFKAADRFVLCHCGPCSRRKYT